MLTSPFLVARWCSVSCVAKVSAGFTDVRSLAVVAFDLVYYSLSCPDSSVRGFSTLVKYLDSWKVGDPQKETMGRREGPQQVSRDAGLGYFSW